MNALVEQTKMQISGLRQSLTQAGRWLVSSGQPEPPPEALAFLDPIDQICAEPAPRYARTTLYSIAAMLIALVTVGALIKVDVVVTANGRLVTSTPPILLQPVERAIIREMRVHPGDRVRKGEVLATLDPTFANADLGSLAAQSANLEAQKQRIDAELEGHPYLLPRNPTESQSLQATLFGQRRANYQSHIRVFDEDVARLNTSIKATEQDNVLLASQLGLARDVEEMRMSLLKSQNGSRLSYLDAQTLRMRTERDYQDSVSRLSELKHQVLSREAERQAYIEDWRRQLLENQAAIQTQLSMVGASISKASLINDMVVVTAPADGVILDAAQRSVGSILHEAEPLFTIVPSDAKLVADIGIGSSDVGSTKPGDAVLMKIDAFPYVRHGMVKGRLAFISEESSNSNSLTGQTNDMRGGDTALRGQVEITDMALKNLPEGAHLMPGMSLRAEIKVGSRSILGFLLSPVTRGLSEAMREQ